MTMSVNDALDVVLRHEELNLPKEVFSVLCESEADDLDQRLIEILEDPEHRVGYPALHSVRLLGERRTVEAAETVARLVAEFTDQNDMINDYGTGALGRMGPDALEPVLAVLEEVGPNGYLEDALVKWDVRDDRIYEALLRLAESEPTLGASFLGQYGDPRGLPVVQRLFDEVEVSDSPFGSIKVFDYAEAVESLGGELTAEQQAKLDDAMDDSARFRTQLETLADRTMPARARQEKGQTFVAGERPGRNEPCWCGSGKKYKKCHLRSDRDD